MSNVLMSLYGHLKHFYDHKLSIIRKISMFKLYFIYLFTLNYNYMGNK